MVVDNPVVVENPVVDEQINQDSEMEPNDIYFNNLFKMSLVEHLRIGSLFENDQKLLNLKSCSVCKQINLKLLEDECFTCKKYPINQHELQENDRNFLNILNPFSSRNDMCPGVVPDCLKDLTLMEQILISPVKPYIYTFFLKRGGQYGYRGQVINFPQNISTIVNYLPHSISSLSECVIFKQPNHDLTRYRDIRVRRQKIQDALSFLMVNHKYFINRIQLSQENLDQLPEDSTIESLLRTIDLSVSFLNDLMF